MQIEQIYTGCLSQGAYYITSNGEAAIIDPLREVQPYIARAQRDGVKIKYIFETHFHADFVSGHLDLAKKTGATIVYGPNADCGFECVSAPDGTIFNLGDCKMQVLHTPGHTMESTTFLLKDEAGNDHAIFTGDTLFLGDVGRPDLAQKSAHLTMEQLAGLLYQSLMNKIMPLADEVLVYPAHGAGSACGKNMMKETVDSLGHQKQVNYALNQPDEAQFIKAVTDGLLPPPHYFGMNVAMNKNGYVQFDEVLKKARTPLTAAQVELAVTLQQALIVDTRSNAVFYKGFIPQSVNIGLEGDFAPWIGTLIADVQQPLILITEAGKETEAITRLSRVGFDVILGYLEGGIEAWIAAGKEVDSVHRIKAEQFAQQFDATKDLVLDMRKESEFVAAHLPTAVNHPLAYINSWIGEIDPNKHFYLHCAGGYRSMAAASILQARGCRNFTEIEGGFRAIASTGLAVTTSVCNQSLSVI